jgi:hypothetical protein
MSTRSIRGRRRAAAVLGLSFAAVAFGGAAPAGASTGVSIDVGAIAITEVLKAGEEYRLPTFGVRNPGTEPTSYVIVVSYMANQPAMQPPAEWFTFSPGSLSLDGGQSKPVSARITLPAGAEPGEYLALIGPKIDGQGTGAQVGAGAAAKVTFTVEPSTWIEGVLRQIWRLVQENPWAVALVLLVVALVLLRFLRHRFSFSVARKS